MPPHHTPLIHRQEHAGWHRESSSAEILLGGRHPLVAVLLACEATQDGIVALGAIQLGALAAWWEHASHASALVISGGVVQLALAVRWAILRADRRQLCLDLVIGGRGDLPLASVTRECRRLREPRHRSQLAATLDDLAAFPMEQHSRRAPRWPICRRVVLAAVEPQLREVAARLRAGDADLRGVAIVERLVTSGCSPLYGDDAGPLREQLGRARFLLVEGNQRISPRET